MLNSSPNNKVFTNLLSYMQFIQTHRHLQRQRKQLEKCCCHYHLDISVCGILQYHCAYPFHVSVTFNLNVVSFFKKGKRREQRGLRAFFYSLWLFDLEYWLLF